MRTSHSIMPPLLLASLYLPLASAWGTLGHEIVANIAWQRVTEATRQSIVQVLGGDVAVNDTGSPLAAVADWADRVRHFLPWSAPLHYIDIRDDAIKGGCHYFPPDNHNYTRTKNHLPPDEDDSCQFVYPRDCPNDVCVAGAIVNYTSQLMAPSSASLRGRSAGRRTSRQQEALKFLTHFIGDIHQPLHCSRTTDKGGNDLHVKFDFNISVAQSRRSTTSHRHPHHSWNLHSVWDTGMIEVALHRDYNHSRTDMETALLQRLDPAMIDEFLQCPNGNDPSCTNAWGQEGWHTALRWAYQLNETNEVVDGSVVSEAYYESRMPIVEHRLLAGGVRLGATLDHIFQNAKSSSALSSTDSSILLSMTSKARGLFVESIFPL